MPKPLPSVFPIFTVPSDLIYDAIQSGNVQSFINLIQSTPVPPQIELSKAFALAIPSPTIFKRLLDTYRCSKIEILVDALQQAAQRNSISIIELLLEYLNHQDTHLLISPELIKQYPEETIKQQANKGIILVYACENGHIDALKALLKDKSFHEFATWDNNALLRKVQEKRKNAIAEKEQRQYDQIINQLTDVPAVAQLAAQQGEIFEKLDYGEKDKCPLLFTFHNIQPAPTNEELNSESQPQPPSHSGNCRIS